MREQLDKLLRHYYIYVPRGQTKDTIEPGKRLGLAVARSRRARLTVVAPQKNSATHHPELAKLEIVTERSGSPRDGGVGLAWCPTYSHGDGPAPRKNGYRPESAWEMESHRLERQLDLVTKLGDQPKYKSKLHDIVAARELYWEVSDRLPRALERYGMTPSEFYARGREWLIDFVNDVPSAAIGAALHERNFRNSYKRWTGNDIRDIDSMIEAVPYCDYVLTDKHVAAQLAKSAVGRNLGTKIFARIRDLMAELT
ncbi:hypothetical protein GCM10010169_63920 [Micromonospora fulviviridis]|uniref:hypothetical protein n=1 Tax=Micromonospora fulviviridis TaxID=47860 RepID=UPI001983FA0D|nr:hypothetical protein [Micromonospora fulviviridis]GGS10448.1 hypothetical protein GCM10010169_63920 [Micromonospora fulviviridis]